MKGVVESGSVQVLAGPEWADVVGAGTTDATGSFEVEVGAARGPLIVEVTGGTYVEEATGETVSLAGRTLRAWVPGMEAGEARTGVMVNPVTTLAVGYTRWRMAALEESFTVAEGHAARLLHDHFGQLDWRVTLPRDLTTAGTVSLSAEVRAGFFLGALSYQALLIETADGADGRAATAAGLLELLDEDLASDGKFNGLGTNRRALNLCGISLDGDTMRRELAVAMVRLLASDRNGSSLVRADVQHLLLMVAQNDSELFDSPPGIADLDPPVIRFENPLAGATVSGRTRFTALATDSVSVIRAFGFLEPERLSRQLAGGIGSHEATLDFSFDTELLPDGPITVRAFAEDNAGYRTEALLELVVSNHGPQVEILSPEAGVVVEGAVTLQARATPNPDTGFPVTSLAALTPAGLDDTDAAPDRFEASWDTADAPEGDVVLRFEATDSSGATTLLEHTVVVDNRERPVIGGVVQVCGRAIPEAVVELQAFNGVAYVSRGTAATDAGGRFEIVLEDDNHTGPVRVVVTGKPDGNTTYRDPIANRDRSFGPTQVLSTWMPTPTASPVTVGLWTTVADALARFYAASMEADESWSTAQEMIAGHFQRPGWPDLHTTQTQDLTESMSREIPDVLLSLGELGLAWLAKDVAVDGGGGGLSAIGAVQVLAEDLSDGYFDGRRGTTALSFGGTTPVDDTTTRAQLAGAIHQFAGSTLNGSGITPQALVDAGFLDMLTTDARAIYRYAGGVPFDRLGPSITWTSPMDGEHVGAATVTVSAAATDDTGVVSFEVLSPSGLLDVEGSVDRLRVDVDNTVAPSSTGVVTIQVQAVDTNGNISTSQRHFVRPEPTAQIEDVLVGGVPAPAYIRGPFRVVASGTEGFATRSFSLTSPVVGVGGDADSAPLRMDVEIDPTPPPGSSIGLPDGPLELVVRHETVDGRSATARRTVTLDNTPPQLVSAALNGALVDGVHWIGADGSGGASGQVVLTYAVRDPVSGVDRCRFGGTGVVAAGPMQVVPTVTPLAGGCKDSACTGDTELTLEAGYYQLEFECWDVAGNGPASHGTFMVTVDPQAPTLTDLSGTFDDEDTLDFVYDAGTYRYPQRDNYRTFDVSSAQSGPVAWNKMTQRLTGTTETEAAANNLPVIRVRALDPGQVATLQADLAVTYLYEHSTDGGATWTAPAGAGWRPVPVSADASHALVLSVDTLAATLRSGGEHRVRVQVRDKAGNGAELGYRFTLQILPAPVAVEVVTDYAAEGDPLSIYPYSFAAGNMGEAFSASSFLSDEWRVFKAILRQPHSDPVPITTRVGAATTDTVRLERQQPQRVLVTESVLHRCVINCDDLVAPDPSVDQPPCVTSWEQADRTTQFKTDADVLGSLNCSTDAQELEEEADETITSDLPVGISILDGAGNTVVTNPAGFPLPQGEYTLVGVIQLTGTFHGVTQVAGTAVFGEIVQTRKVFDSDEETMIGRWESVFGGSSMCVRNSTSSTCNSQRWRTEVVVDYEAQVSWTGPGGVVRVNVLTGNGNTLRDPFTNNSSHPDNPEIYPVSKLEIEQGLTP